MDSLEVVPLDNGTVVITNASALVPNSRRHVGPETVDEITLQKNKHGKMVSITEQDLSPDTSGIKSSFSSSASSGESGESGTVVEHAADWIYNQARNAGLFSYSSDDTKSRVDGALSFSTSIDGKSTFSESVVTEDPRVKLVNDIPMIPRREVCNEFKKIIALSKQLQMSPEDLIERLQQGDH
jgi:hypothetical protein